MNHNIQNIFNEFEISLSEQDNRKITSSLNINDLRKNPTEEQEANLRQVCQLIKDGAAIDSAISKITQQEVSEISTSVSDELMQIIIQQANLAADQSLLALPKLAESETINLRNAFVTQFRIRIESQLKSAEYQAAFIEQIQCLGEPPTLNSSTPITALPSSSSTNS